MNDPRPAYAQIADDLRDEIKNGHMPPPSRMPSQRELAERYGVAPETLRKALDMLAREGVVSAGSTRGTFVLRVPGEPEPDPDFLRLAEVVNQLADRMALIEDRLQQLEDERNG